MDHVKADVVVAGKALEDACRLSIDDTKMVEMVVRYFVVDGVGAGPSVHEVCCTDHHHLATTDGDNEQRKKKEDERRRRREISVALIITVYLSMIGL